MSCLSGGCQQTLLAKFLSLTIQSFRNTIGVKQDGVAWIQFAFFHCAFPFLEQAHHRAAGKQTRPSSARKRPDVSMQPQSEASVLGGIGAVYTAPTFG
jgi:hypothetical protein